MTTFMESLFCKILATWSAKMGANIWQDLSSPDPMKEVLDKTYHTFKEHVPQDDNILAPLFEEFFTHDLTIIHLEKIFTGQGEQVDFTKLEEIFAWIGANRNIELGDFNVYLLFSQMMRELETQTQQHPAFHKIFQVGYAQRMVELLEKRGTEPNYSYARLKYVQHLQRFYNKLPFSGIPDLKEKQEIPLPQIFVMQRACESVPVDTYERLYQEKLSAGDETFTGHEHQMRRWHFSQKESRGEAVKFDQILKESGNRRFVILGKPGSGKSSLLKFLLLQEAERLLANPREIEHLCLPILVEIRKFENALKKTTQADYNLLDYLYDAMRQHFHLSLPPRFFETWLEIGRAVVLFDGLDEVAAESRREGIRQMIASFVAGYHPGNTVIVTSRITGYNRAQFSTTEYRHFTLEDFNDEEIKSFIEKWYGSRLLSAAEVVSKVTDLQAALAKKPRIKELARNPLLLTIIGIIHRYEAQLPEDRLLLYDKATESLLYTWDNVKELIDEKFKPDAKRRFLEKVAFHLQSQEKGEEAGTVIRRHEVYQILFPEFTRIFRCEEWQARGLVDEFLDIIRSRAGVLTEQAPDQFGFVHKTFQEYFAARCIANEALLKFNLQIIIDYVDRFIDNAFWHETLLLAIRALPNEQALKVLEHILQRDRLGIEADFYHNHYFVMKFIAEQGQWLENPEFVETQINDFFNFSWNDGKDRSYYSDKTWNRFKEWVSTVTDPLVVSLISERLLPVAEDKANDGYLRLNFASALGNLGVKDKAVELLLTMAQDKANDVILRLSCASTLGNLGVKDKAVEIILTMAQNQANDVSLRRECASALGKLGVKDKAVVEFLLTMAQDLDNDVWLRLDYASALGDLGVKDKAVEILLEMAQDLANNVWLRFSCAEALGDLGVKDIAVVEFLLTMAQDLANGDDIYYHCALALGKLGVKEKAVEILLKMAQDLANHFSIRRNCAEALGNLGVKDKAVVEFLLTMAQDLANDVDLRLACASALGNLGGKNKAVAILIDLYLAQPDKMEYETRRIYESLWELTALKDGS